MLYKLNQLSTEQINENSIHIDEMNTMEILTLINQEDKRVALSVQEEIPNIAIAADEIVKAIRNGGRLVYMGAGTSGRLGILDAAECPPTFSTGEDEIIGLIAGGQEALVRAVEGAEDNWDEAVRQLQDIGFSDRDILVGIAASGRTPYVIEGINYANSIGSATISVSCTAGSAISRLAKIAIEPIVGAEVIAGSTRMKAGTAQKMVLNMLTTCSMIKLGKVYGNLMVDVQPTNQKLIERAQNIVCTVAGISKEAAMEYLKAAGMNSKAAIVMAMKSCTREEALELLEKAQGFLREALEM